VTGSRVSWVKVLLATAGAWRRPVGDLELTVEGADDEYLSFCWDGPIRKTGPHTYQATLRDFVPTRDLTVYSFKPGPDRPAAR